MNRDETLSSQVHNLLREFSDQINQGVAPDIEAMLQRCPTHDREIFLRESSKIETEYRKSHEEAFDKSKLADWRSTIVEHKDTGDQSHGANTNHTHLHPSSSSLTNANKPQTQIGPYRLLKKLVKAEWARSGWLTKSRRYVGESR